MIGLDCLQHVIVDFGTENMSERNANIAKSEDWRIQARTIGSYSYAESSRMTNGVRNERLRFRQKESSIFGPIALVTARLHMEIIGSFLGSSILKAIELRIDWWS